MAHNSWFVWEKHLGLFSVLSVDFAGIQTSFETNDTFPLVFTGFIS